MSEKEKTRRFKCYICGQEFDSLIELTKHNLKLKHERVKPPSQTPTVQKQTEAST